MIDLLKKTALTAIGATVITKERVEAALKDSVERGKLTVEEAKALSQKIIEEGRQEFEENKTKLSQSIEELKNRAPFISLAEFNQLKERVSMLEQKLADCKSAAESSQS
jgi:polyhydroxyalkanoate synthesis regulator phasin